MRRRHSTRPGRRAHRLGERQDRVGRDPGQRAPGRRRPGTLRASDDRRLDGLQPERARRSARSGRSGTWNGAEDVRHERRPASDAADRTTIAVGIAVNAQPGGRRVHVARAGSPTLPSSSGCPSGSGRIQRRPCRREVELDAKNGETAAEREDRAAHVVNEPGQRQLGRARRRHRPSSAASRTVTTETRPGQRDRGREPVRAGADDDRVHRVAGVGRPFASRAAAPAPRSASPDGRHVFADERALPPRAGLAPARSPRREAVAVEPGPHDRGRRVGKRVAAQQAQRRPVVLEQPARGTAGTSSPA